MISSGVLERFVSVVLAEGTSEGTATAMCANTLRSWATAGTNHRGEELRREVRDVARQALTEHDKALRGNLSEAEARLARLEASGVRLDAALQEKIGGQLHHRASLAEGLVTSFGTPLGRPIALKFLSVRDASDEEISSRLRAIADTDGLLSEALGYARATGPGRKAGTYHGMHGTQKATRHKSLKPGKGTITCVHCGVPVLDGASICPNCQKPPTSPEVTPETSPYAGSTLVEAGAMRPGARSGRGKKPPPKPGEQPKLMGPDGKPISADTDFNKLHPRQRGGPGGGRFIQKGDGQDQEHGDDNVAQAQSRLAQLGHPLVADGKFGPKTEGAVKEFQKKYGLPTTGKIDLATAEMMRNPPPQDIAQVNAADLAAQGGTKKSASASGKKSTSKKSTSKRGSSRKSGSAAGSTAAGSSGVLKLGAGTPTQPNPQVQKAQQALQNLGFDVGTDGVFGKDTQRAIQRLQMMTGLKVDGIIGPATLQMLQLQAQRLQQQDQEMYGTSLPATAGKGASARRSVTKTRRARTLTHARVEEASFQNGFAQPYGGVVMAAIPVVPGDFPDPADETDTRMRPPNLREAANGSWEACLNCVHFNTKERCLLHAYPVDADDLCDNHLSLTPQEQRHWGGYMEAFRDVVEARAAGDGSALARAEARRDFHREKLDEFWSEASRVAALAARRAHGGSSAGRTAADTNGHRHAEAMVKPRSRKEMDRAMERVGSHHGSRVDVKRMRAELDARTEQQRRSVREARPGSKSQDDRAKRAVGGSAGRTGGDSNGHRHAVALMGGKRSDPRDGAKQITEVKSSAYPGLDRSPKKNWVDKAGGLPTYIERIAKHLHYEKGKDIGQSIAIAVNVVKKMCASGDTNFPGKQSVNAGSRAEACNAVKQWEAKKLRHGVMREAATRLEREPIPKGAVGLGFALRTVREVQTFDRLIAEGSYKPSF